MEPLKILGHLNADLTAITPATFAISAQCNRVAVIDGHLECVSVRLRKEASVEDVVEALEDWQSEAQTLQLPSAPARVHTNHNTHTHSTAQHSTALHCTRLFSSFSTDPGHVRAVCSRCVFYEARLDHSPSWTATWATSAAAQRTPHAPARGSTPLICSPSAVAAAAAAAAGVTGHGCERGPHPSLPSVVVQVRVPQSQHRPRRGGRQHTKRRTGTRQTPAMTHALCHTRELLQHRYGLTYSRLTPIRHLPGWERERMQPRCEWSRSISVL